MPNRFTFEAKINTMMIKEFSRNFGGNFTSTVDKCSRRESDIRKKIYMRPVREAIPRPVGEVQAVRMKGSEGVGEIEEVADVRKSPGSN